MLSTEETMPPLSVLSIVGLLITAVPSVAAGDPAQPCTSNCKLPDCFCSGTVVPGNLPESNIPQIVYITFDAALNTFGFHIYEELFNGELKNPNNCTISATFFVSHQYNDYSYVQNLYSQRHEIAVNSISRRLPASWWKNATEKEWADEMGGMREILRKWGNVDPEDVKGVRSPYLQGGGNTEFQMLKDNKFLYESSMPAQRYTNPPLWPYTLDYRSIQHCVIQPCPTDSFPGVWEVPLVDYTDKYGTHCNIITSCAPPSSEEEALELLRSNFERHYKTNRAPFPMLLEYRWLIDPDHPQNLQNLNATKRFLKELMEMGDVWVVTISQMIEWIRNPTTLDKVKEFEPWKCDSKPPPGCASQDVKACCFPDQRVYMRTCAPQCPPHYPWVGNPDGN